jgi:hypothetical protein
MKKITFYKKVHGFFFFFFMFIAFGLNAQVGVGTSTPDPSSVLDVSSTTQGMLMPRMTTAQRNAIASPANGLMVFDTDLNSIVYYLSSTSSWSTINNEVNGRLKFKRIKSTDVLSTVLAAEKTAGGNTRYLLDSQTLYEINGTVNVDLPIELNNAYIIGLDSSDDKLIKSSGDLFVGTTGGSIRVLTLSASSGNVFNITGTGSIGAGTQSQSLILRDGIISNSSNVGKIENFGLVFVSIVQYVSNANGVVYKDINKLLVNNAGWFGNNSGTYETLQGTFGLVGKIGGFSEVVGNSIGLSVGTNPVINNDAVLREVVFTGTVTSGKYINGYTTGSYTGFSFNNKWAVNCPGIPIESDQAATGDVNFDYPVGSGASTTFSGTGSKSKLGGNTTSNNLFRFTTDSQNNRLKYMGGKKRFFIVKGALSFQSTANTTVYIIYVAKNGTIVNQSKVYISSNSSSDIVAIPLVSTVELAPNDYIEVWAERFSGTGNMLTVSLNLSVD